MTLLGKEWDRSTPQSSAGLGGAGQATVASHGGALLDSPTALGGVLRKPWMQGPPLLVAGGSWSWI